MTYTEPPDWKEEYNKCLAYNKKKKQTNLSQQKPNGSVHSVGFAASHDNKEKAVHNKQSELSGGKDGS